MNKVMLPVAAVAVLAGSYVAFPYYAVNRLDGAVRTNDQAQLESMVDWSAVRHGLKADLITLMTGAVAQPSERNPGLQLSQAVIAMLGPKVVENIVEAYATPAGLTDLIRNGGEIDMKAAAARTVAEISGAPAGETATPPGVAEKPDSDAEPAEGTAQPITVTGAHFVGLNKMEVEFEDPQNPDRPAVKGILALDGLSWKMTRIVLPVDEMLDAPQTAERPN